MMRESPPIDLDAAPSDPPPSVEESIRRAGRVIESTHERIEETRRVIDRARRILARAEPDEG